MSLWTEREQEVVALVRRGLTYQEVADELGISSTTVRTHVSRAARLLPGAHTPLRKILRMRRGPESTPSTLSPGV